MLVTIEKLLGTPVMSLQTGAKLAEITTAIVDPRQLVIVAFGVEGHGLETSPSVLHPNDIRELGDLGMIVDSAEKLTSLDGLVRLQEVIDFNFNLTGLKVIDEQKNKLGKVASYGVDTNTYTIVQIYTEQHLLRSLTSSGRTIHRSQIVSVNNEVMVVHSPTVKEEVDAPATDLDQAFVNPFRGTRPQANGSSSSSSASRISS